MYEYMCTLIHRYIPVQYSGVSKTNMRLAIGKHNITEVIMDYVDGDWSNIYRIKEIHIHPNYKYHHSTRTSENDIALLQTQKHINFDYQLSKPICLPRTKSKQYTNEEAFVVGKYRLAYNCMQTLVTLPHI